MFCLSCKVTDAESADVVIAAARHKDGIEVAEADGAVVLKDLALDLVMHGIVVANLHVTLIDLRLDSHLVALPDFSVLYSSMSQPPLLPFAFFG